MKAEALLNQLKDIQNPNAISMWPATIAWYILFAIIIIIIAWLLIKLMQRLFKRKRQQHALTLLKQAVARYPKNANLAIADISTLLRRIALAKFKRKNVASLSNQAWLIFLDETLSTKKRPCKEFSTGIGKLLISAPYQKNSSCDIDALAKLVERWIKGVL